MAIRAAAPGRPEASRIGLKGVALGLLGLLALCFIAKYVFYYYLHYGPAGFRYYWPRRFGLLIHITCGMVALVTGPWQFSSRLRRRNLQFHRVLGRVYLIAVALGASAAFYLAITTTLGWAWGFAVAMLGVAWVTTSGMAYYSVLLRQIQVHREWMVRSYVVTFAFVTFRVMTDYFPGPRLQPAADLEVTAMWTCWTLPLLATEVILQLRKMPRLTASSRQAPRGSQKSALPPGTARR